MCAATTLLILNLHNNFLIEAETMTSNSAQPLPSTRRVVTSHNDDAKAIISHDSRINGRQTAHGPCIQLLWSSESLPPDVNGGQDQGLADTGLSNDGTIVRIVDFPPKSQGMVHRSMTLDYIFVLKGQVVLTLDDRSRTVVKENEAVIQQAAMHGWDNETDDWARLLCVLIKAQPPVVNGKELGSEIPFQV